MWGRSHRRGWDALLWGAALAAASAAASEPPDAPPVVVHLFIGAPMPRADRDRWATESPYAAGLDLDFARAAAQATAGAAAAARRAGGTVLFQSRRAPYLVVRVPAASIDEVAGATGVVNATVETPRVPGLAEAVATIRGDRVHRDYGLTGKGASVCLLEEGAPYLAEQFTVREPQGEPTAHATYVAEMLQAVAPGARALVANEDGAEAGAAPALEWCLDRGTPIVNVSSSTSSAADGLQSAFERYLEAVATAPPFPLVVGITNNDGAARYTGVKIHNGLVVGGAWEQGDSRTDNDLPDPRSNARNPDAAMQDWELPHLAAPSVLLQMGLAAVSGTSFSAPQVSGASALLLQRDPSLRGWPEALRALLVYGAGRSLDPPSGEAGGARVFDDSIDQRGGAGVLDVFAAVAALDRLRAGGAEAAWVRAAITEEEFNARGYWKGGPLRVRSPGGAARLRVAMAWDRTSACATPGRPCAGGRALDLDLEVFDPAGRYVAWSQSWENSMELLEAPAPLAGDYQVRVRMSWGWVGAVENHLALAAEVRR